MKKISIIVPVYNTKNEYLRECLDSIVNQTIKKEIEIIIVDDGSKEKCAKICDEYAKKYENIQVIHQENQGLAISRNNGMKQAKGEWIMFVDSDDWVEENICEKLIEEVRDDIDIVISSCNNCYKNKIVPVKMFDGKDMEWDKNKEELELQIISKFVLGEKSYDSPYLAVACAKLYKRKFIADNKLNDVCQIKFREDNIFNLYCFENANKIVYKNYYLYNYRQCKNSLIHRDNWNMINPYIKYLEEEKKFIRKYNKSAIFYEAYKVRIIQSSVNIIGQYIFKGKCKYSEKINKIKEIMKNEDFIYAVKNVNTSCLSKYFKIMVFLLRNKMYGMVNILYTVREFIKEKNKKNMYE